MIIYKAWTWLVLCRVHLGSSVCLFSILEASRAPRQFAFTLPTQNELTTVRALVGIHLGLSCVRPCCLWQPKNFSRGSGHSRSVRKTLMPGMEKKAGIISRSEFTTKNKIPHAMNITSFYTSFHMHRTLRLHLIALTLLGSLVVKALSSLPGC